MAEKKSKKIKAKVIGQDANVFVTLGICTNALENAGKEKESDEMNSRVLNAKSYPEALNIMREYCEFTK